MYVCTYAGGQDSFYLNINLLHLVANSLIEADHSVSVTKAFYRKRDWTTSYASAEQEGGRPQSASANAQTFMPQNYEL